MPPPRSRFIWFLSEGLMPSVDMRLDEACEALAAEQRKVRSERDAYREFERRVSEVPPAEPPPDLGGGGMQLLEGQTTGTGLRQVEQAYRETVMSVEHYDRDYGEAFLEHLESELGPRCAEAIQSESQLTLPLKQSLLMTSADVRERRTLFARVLDEEERLLERIDAFLEEIRPLPTLTGEESFDELRGLHEELVKYERRAKTLLSDRQDHLHRSWSGIARSNRIDPKSLNDYLYESLSTTYPALNLLTETVVDIRSTRQEIDRQIAHYRG